MKIASFILSMLTGTIGILFKIQHWPYGPPDNAARTGNQPAFTGKHPVY
ncbi:hypothetical protein [Chitinophaga deserti]|nr:hypothetical protein [Chitinophaga deserti]